MVRVYAAADLPDAHIVLGLLRQAGIDARVLNEHAWGGLGDIPFGEAYPQVWIADEADLPRARSIVAHYQAKPPAVGARRCHACGEASPGNFELCWQCGARL